MVYGYLNFGFLRDISICQGFLDNLDKFIKKCADKCKEQRFYIIQKQSKSQYVRLYSISCIAFTNEFGKPNTSLTVVEFTTNILFKHGWIPNGTIQKAADIYIPEYFAQ